MIKMKNKILVGVLSFLVTVTVGFALFSEELRINGTANASGTFDLTFECEEPWVPNGGSGDCKPSGNNSIMTTSTLTKPTDYAMYTVTVTNTGSIPAVLSEVKSFNNALNDDLNSPGDEVYFDKNTFLLAYYEICSEKTGDCFYGNQEVANAEITIQPGETIYFDVVHEWYDSYNESRNTPQPALPDGGATMNYDLEFKFVQKTTA